MNQSESIMKSMLRFVIKERRYLNRMWIIQKRAGNTQYQNNNFFVKWVEAKTICQKLINIYRAK